MQLVLNAALPGEKLLLYQRPEWLGGLEIDILLPKRWIAIEVQGRWHYMPVPGRGGDERFERQKICDRRKRKLCRAEGIKLFEVNCNTRDLAPAIRTALDAIAAHMDRRLKPVDVETIVAGACKSASTIRRPSQSSAYSLINVDGRVRSEPLLAKARRIDRVLSSLGSDVSVSSGNVHLVWWMDDARVPRSIVEDYLRREHGINLLNLCSSHPDRRRHLRGYAIPYSYGRRTYTLRQGQAVELEWRDRRWKATFLGVQDDNRMLICMKKHNYDTPFKIDLDAGLVVPVSR